MSSVIPSLSQFRNTDPIWFSALEVDINSFDPTETQPVLLKNSHVVDTWNFEMKSKTEHWYEAIPKVWIKFLEQRKSSGSSVKYLQTFVFPLVRSSTIKPLILASSSLRQTKFCDDGSPQLANSGCKSDTRRENHFLKSIAAFNTTG